MLDIYISDESVGVKISLLENCINSYIRDLEFRDLLYYSRAISTYLKEFSNDNNYAFIAKKVSFNLKIGQGIIKLDDEGGR